MAIPPRRIPIRELDKVITNVTGDAEIIVDDGLEMGRAKASDAVDARARDVAQSEIADLNLGTASQSNVEDFATFNQGQLADSATQPGDLGDLAVKDSVSNADWSGTDLAIEHGGTGASSADAARNNLGLGTAATTDADEYATAAQGEAADTAIQPGDPPLVPEGGAAGQVLAKNTSDDFSLEWVTSEAASAVSYAPQFLTPEQQEQARDNLGATDIGDALFTADTASAARGTINVGEQGTGSAQHRTNAQNDARFLHGVFAKADPRAVAFARTGNGAISIKAGTVVSVASAIYTFDAATPVTMPSLTAGTDYIIWIRPDGTLEATTSFTSPPVAGARRLGGFHYAPGGNAPGYNSGGNSTPQINPFSIWDEKFRPACPDPRGMALVAGGFWCDIYLCGVNHHVDGTSKFNVTIADGDSPARVPPIYGGNGSNTYSDFTWYNAAETMASHGKQLLDHAEFSAAVFGTREEQASGSDPITTLLDSDYTSVWGIMLATGNMWVWSREFGYRGDGTWSYSWVEGETDGRGGINSQGAYGVTVARLGGHWDAASYAGSRASLWGAFPWNSGGDLSARGRSDHICQT